MVTDTFLPLATEQALADAIAAKAAADKATYALADPAITIVRDGTTGNVTSVTEDDITTVYTYNTDGSVATSKRGTGPARTFSYSNGDLTAVS